MRGPAPMARRRPFPPVSAASCPDDSLHPPEKREQQARPSSSGEPPFPHPEEGVAGTASAGYDFSEHGSCLSLLHEAHARKSRQRRWQARAACSARFAGMTRSRTMDATIQGLRRRKGLRGCLKTTACRCLPCLWRPSTNWNRPDEWFFATDGREPLSGLPGFTLRIWTPSSTARSAAKPQGRPRPLSWLRAPRRGAPELAVPLSAGCGPSAPRAVASVGGRMERSRNGTPVP